MATTPFQADMTAFLERIPTPAAAAAYLLLDARDRADVDYRRESLGLPQLEKCEGCELGIVALVTDDCAPETGPCFVAADGGSYDDRVALCAACAAADEGSAG